MKLYNKHTFYLIALMVLLMACDTGFDELNVNPNEPTAVDQTFLFTHAQRVPFGDSRVITEALSHGYVWSQQLSFSGTNADIYTRHQFEVQNAQREWERYYNTETPNLSDLLRQFENETDELKAVHVNRKAMVTIVLALLTQETADLFGGMPYADAFRAFDFDDQSFVPTYDTQQEIYDQLFDQLKSAASALTTDSNQENFTVDIWFDNDISKWKKLANSLRLRLAMRISKVDEAKARTVIDELLSDPNSLMASNDENFIFKFANLENQGIFNVAENRRNRRAPSKNMVEFLEGSGDPRLRIFFNRTISGDNPGTFVGVPVSPDERDASGLFLDDSSNDYSGEHSLLQENAWINKKFPETVITYAEVLLLRAEIAQRGWSSENAEQLYNDGIRASIEYYSQLYKDGNVDGGFPENPDYEVTSSEIDDLVENPLVKYDAANALNQIIIQQWIHHHRNPRELYSNFRRTDIPNADSTPAFETMVADGVTIPRSQIPKRFTYPDTEFALNGTNVNALIDIQGPNNELTRVWWDVD